jgi:hypothetical protein
MDRRRSSLSALVFATVACSALPACSGADPTLLVDLSLDPAELPVHEVIVQVDQEARVVVRSRVTWQADEPRIGLFLPADISGQLQVVAIGLNAASYIVGTGNAVADVDSGRVSAPVALVLRSQSSGVGPPDDGGVADAVPSDDAIDAGFRLIKHRSSRP